MSRIRSLILAAAVLVLLQAPARAVDNGDSQDFGVPFFFKVVVERFGNDPTRRFFGRFDVRGDEAVFTHDKKSAPRFAGDRRGSLAVTYDSSAPTARYFRTFPGGFTQDDDFVFGSVLTIRPQGFAADPFGFHPISFSLFNSTTTGDERTGNVSDFRADTYDTLEFSYFPNVSPLFGGPYLSPDVFGESVDADAFANFAFSSIQLDLMPGVTYLVLIEHSSADQTLTTKVFVLHPAGRAFPLEGGTTVTDLSGITGFLVNSLGISAYQDGFNEFAPSGHSLLATVDYDLLFSGPRVNGHLPLRIALLLHRLQGRPSRLRHTDPGRDVAGE